MVRFSEDADPISQTEKFKYGVPTSDLYPIEPSADGTYICHTHDRGDSCVSGPFYQVAFRITDPSPYTLEELSLCIFLRNDAMEITNDLFCASEDKADIQKNLWYQRTKYIKRKGHWEYYRKEPIDSITTSGIFQIAVRRNGTILTDIDIPWIYILPSAISKEDYIEMLSDLFALHERIITNTNSTIGIGEKNQSKFVNECLEEEVDAIKELENAILSIQSVQSEQLGKRYSRVALNKAKRYDAKVIKDYLQHGVSGKALSVTYVEDHDTYENRVIKYFLKQIESRLCTEKPISAPVELNYEEEVQKQYKEIMNISSRSRSSKKYVSAEETGMRTDLMAKFQKEQLIQQIKYEYYTARKELVSLLSDPWFSGISEINYLDEIKQTPKFLSNAYYSRIYDIIVKMAQDHPHLILSFDYNSFGVYSTEHVYECWVFYKLLYHIQSLGFTINETDTLIDHFRNFISSSTSPNLKHYHVTASRGIGDKQMILEIGNEHSFSATVDGGRVERTPDYYLKISHRNVTHWFFFDAKYKCFTSDPQTAPDRVDYCQEIYDVAVAKYLYTMSQIFQYNPQEYGSNNKICGAYIIGANFDDANIPLSQNGRLFGGTESLFQKSIHKKPGLVDGIGIDNKNGFPAHRYGAIQLTPGNDKELRTLFLLIFEYLDSNMRDHSPQLSVCWNCGAAIHEKDEKKTEKGYAKYYSTCPACHAFRADTHCSKCGFAIIKHTYGNYHQRDSLANNRWAFICPWCGDSLKPKQEPA